MIKRIFCVIMSISMLFTVLSLTGCKEKDGSGYLFRSGLPGDPEILDPQIATDYSALTVIKNIYIGLLDIASDGSIVEGIAEDYTVSEDGLVYNFKLKKDYKWESADKNFEAEVTAHDFEFAFQRIFNPYTNSPYNVDFLCLENARDIMNGSKNYNQIGVNALSDYEIEFKLENPNANFPALLTSSAAMPCNKDFFDAAKGKYGLETDKIASNGAFYVKDWRFDSYGTNNYLILRKNQSFASKTKVYPSSLNFFIHKNEEQIEDDFFKNQVDCIVSRADNEKIFKEKYARTEYKSNSVGIIINEKSNVFMNRTFRQALSYAIDRKAFSDKLPRGTVPAYALVPEQVTMLNKSYRELVSENNMSVYNSSKAKELWQNGLKNTGRFTIDGMSILVPSSYKNADALKFITQEWQNELGFFCGIEVVSDEEYELRIKRGQYDIAFYNLSCTFNSPISILNNFYSKSSLNLSGYKNGVYDSLIEKASRTKTLNECVDIYAKAEREIIDNCIYIPIFYETEFLVYKKDIADINYNPFTHQMDFKNAKNFD